MLRAGFAVLFAILVPVSAYAALVPAQSVQVAISAAPAYQRPNDLVTLRAYAEVPKGTFTYSWQVNGKDAASGIDADSIRINAGAPGAQTTVTVTLTSGAGVSGTAEYVIVPADVDLLWEGETYVPPFYKGKTYPNGGSPISLWAVPHVTVGGAEVPARELNYTWVVDGSIRPSLSGYGKSSARVLPAQFKNATVVTVTVETPDGSAAAQAAVSIPHVVPSLLIYEDRPLSGLWTQRAITAPYQLLADEASFRAVPFFASAPSALKFTWALGGKNFAVPGADPAEVTFRRTSDSGAATVDVSAEKSGSIFEQMRTTFNLSFK